MINSLGLSLTSLQPLRQMALAHLQAQSWDEAGKSLRLLAAMAPDDAWCQQWLVVVAIAQHKPAEAIEAAEAALRALAPSQTQARCDVSFNLGQAHGLIGRPAAALAAFDQALALQPDFAPALLGRAKALAQLGEHGQAGRAATQVLMQEPRNLDALALVANSLIKADAPEQALEKFLLYEHLKPASPFTASMVVFLMRQLADWRAPRLPMTRDEVGLLRDATAAGRRPDLALLEHRAWQDMPALEPFSSLVLYDDPALHQHVARQFLEHMHPPAAQPSETDAHIRPACPRSGPVRVAYVSCDFKEHATSYLLAGVLARHDPTRVKVYLLSFAPPRPDGREDALQKRLMTLGHTWVDIHRWSDADVANWCRGEGIEVAVDLKGLTRDCRIGIFAHRAAPVQVNWLGYPGTLPAPYYDWVLADAHVVPPELEPHFSERVWRLPHTYQPNDPDRVIDPIPQRRSEHGLPERGLVLVCFNQAFKITPEVWKIWMRLLLARPDAVLWLLDGLDVTKRNLRIQAEQNGVAADRIVFAPKRPQAQHLARLALADLSLDTLPYNAHTTAGDALWAGVPHIACTGKSFAARVGASVLSAAGMPDLITYGLDDYEALARRLLLDDGERLAIRARLAECRATAPLWDAGAFAKDIEAFFEHIRFSSAPQEAD